VSGTEDLASRVVQQKADADLAEEADRRVIDRTIRSIRNIGVCFLLTYPSNEAPLQQPRSSIDEFP